MQNHRITLLGCALFIVLVGGALLFARPTAQPNARPTTTINVAENETLRLGKSLYEANCSSCHGASGAGYANERVPAPAINGQEHAWHHPDEQILTLIRQGGNMMPAVGADWREDEVEAVWAYVKQWWSAGQRNAQPGDIGEF